MQLVVAFGVSPLLDSFGSDGVRCALDAASTQQGCPRLPKSTPSTRGCSFSADHALCVIGLALSRQIGYALVMGGCAALTAVPVCERAPPAKRRIESNRISAVIRFLR